MPVHFVDTSIAFPVLNDVEDFKEDGGESEILSPLKECIVFLDFHTNPIQTISKSNRFCLIVWEKRKCYMTSSKKVNLKKTVINKNLLGFQNHQNTTLSISFHFSLVYTPPDHNNDDTC